MRDVFLVIVAALHTFVGFALLALGQTPHWRVISARGRGDAPGPAVQRRARRLGTLAFGVGLVAAFKGEGASFGPLLFVLLLGASGIAVAFTLTYRPRWLRPLLWALGPEPKRFRGSTHDAGSLKK